MTAREEAERLVAFLGSSREAFAALERQLGVLVIRSQVLLSLCGIVITVTGFSGRAIAAQGLAARVLVIVGLVVVLLAAAVVVAGVFRVTWLTQTIQTDELATLTSCIALRDSKTRYLKVGLAMFLAGFAAYVAAVSMLLAVG